MAAPSAILNQARNRYSDNPVIRRQDYEAFLKLVENNNVNSFKATVREGVPARSAQFDAAVNALPNEIAAFVKKQYDDKSMFEKQFLIANYSYIKILNFIVDQQDATRKLFEHNIQLLKKNASAGDGDDNLTAAQWKDRHDKLKANLESSIGFFTAEMDNRFITNTQQLLTEVNRSIKAADEVDQRTAQFAADQNLEDPPMAGGKNKKKAVKPKKQLKPKAISKKSKSKSKK